MHRVLGGWVFQRRVTDRVGRANNLGGTVLALRRPHGETGEEAPVMVAKLAESVGYVASGREHEPAGQLVYSATREGERVAKGPWAYVV